MSLPHPESAKYQARIPCKDYGRHREKCIRLGLSFNEGLVEAIRHWLALADDAAPPPIHRKLSAVFREDMGAMEARLMAALEALRPPAYTVSVGGVDTIALGLGLPADQVAEDLAEDLAESMKALIKDSKVNPAHGFQIVPNAELGQEVTLIPFDPVFAAPMKTVSTREGQSLTIPGGLEWDAPIPTDQRLYPEEPPVNALAREPLEGQVWVITGALDTMTKDHARERLIAAGANVVGIVSKHTSAVVFGNAANEEKLNRADELGIPVWSEQQLLAMLKYIEPIKETAQ